MSEKFYRLRDPISDDVWRALGNAKQLELFRLGDGLPLGSAPLPGVEHLHGYPILARATLAQPAQITELCALLGAANEEGTLGMRCFDPHHAVRVTTPDGPLDLLICFACTNVEIHRPGKKQPEFADLSWRPVPFFASIFPGDPTLAGYDR